MGEGATEGATHGAAPYWTEETNTNIPAKVGAHGGGWRLTFRGRKGENSRSGVIAGRAGT